MNLIEQVLDLDANAKKGPWDYRKDHTGDCDVNMFSANDDLVARMFFGAKGFEEAELVKVYRTAAPKLARAIDRVKARISEAAKADEPPTEEDLARWLAEIEKEIAP